MLSLRRIPCFALFLGVLAVSASHTQARDIGGTISTTLSITEDSQLVDDVTCTVMGAPCIILGASGITLDLNGFTMTGLGNGSTGCGGGPTAFSAGASEDAVFAMAQSGITIRGPGLIQRFRGAGIFTSNSDGVTATDVTISTNCLSGILIGGGSDHRFEGNISVRNGNGTFPCGGI
jgi:hypothetical protein